MKEKTPSDSTPQKNAKKTFPPLVAQINEALLEKKAEEIIVLDVGEITTLTDFFIICHGGSDIQVKALARHVAESVKENTGTHVWQKEGLDNKKWVILDYIDVVVHIFLKETREYYKLEKMWSDAPITTITD